MERKKWKPARETRNVSYSRTCNNIFYSPSFGYQIPPNAVLTEIVTQSGDVQRMLVQAAGSGTFGSNSGWDVDLSGIIYQKVVEDFLSNEWYNTGNP